LFCVDAVKVKNLIADIRLRTLIFGYDAVIKNNQPSVMERVGATGWVQDLGLSNSVKTKSLIR